MYLYIYIYTKNLESLLPLSWSSCSKFSWTTGEGIFNKCLALRLWHKNWGLIGVVLRFPAYFFSAMDFGVQFAAWLPLSHDRRTFMQVFRKPRRCCTTPWKNQPIENLMSWHRAVEP